MKDKTVIVHLIESYEKKDALVTAFFFAEFNGELAFFCSGHTLRYILLTHSILVFLAQVATMMTSKVSAMNYF